MHCRNWLNFVCMEKKLNMMDDYFAEFMQNQTFKDSKSDSFWHQITTGPP